MEITIGSPYGSHSPTVKTLRIRLKTSFGKDSLELCLHLS